MTEKRTAGGNIASYCTKCKLVLDHAIVAMIGEEIGKVKCKTCSSVHKFRSEAPAPKPEGAKKRSASKKMDPAQAAEAHWETSLSEAKGKELAYMMTGKYRVGDVVVHSLFGKGVVRKTYINKCDVLFKDKERLMATAG